MPLPKGVRYNLVVSHKTAWFTAVLPRSSITLLVGLLSSTFPQTVNGAALCKRKHRSSHMGGFRNPILVTSGGPCGAIPPIRQFSTFLWIGGNYYSWFNPINPLMAI